MEYVLIHGNPIDGFNIVGPITPNDQDLERYCDIALKNDSWWYVKVESLEEAMAEAGLEPTE